MHYSWLDHIVTSVDMHNSINGIEVLYSVTDDDHIPVKFNISLASMPKITVNNNNHAPKIKWNNIHEDKILEYHNFTSSKFDNVNISVDTLCCRNAKCNDISHREELDQFFNEIVDCMQNSSKNLLAN